MVGVTNTFSSFNVTDILLVLRIPLHAFSLPSCKGKPFYIFKFLFTSFNNITIKKNFSDQEKNFLFGKQVLPVKNDPLIKNLRDAKRQKENDRTFFHLKCTRSHKKKDNAFLFVSISLLLRMYPVST